MKKIKAKKMRIIGYYVELIRKLEQELCPRYNDFVVEIIEERANEKTGQIHKLDFFVPTLYRKLSKQRIAKLKELFGCQEVILLDEDSGESRKLCIEFVEMRGCQDD